MNFVQDIFGVFWPPASVVMAALTLAWAAKWTARRSQQGTSGMLYQLFNWLIAAFAIITIIVLLPLTPQTQGQVLSLLGVVLTAVIALSATTFVAIMIAGIMLQASQPFVLVHELRDHAIVYRICGFLPNMKYLLSSRSNLRKKVLEQMHGNQFATSA